MVYTTSGVITISQANAILVQVNTALTGTITCAANGTTFAVITNPTVGNTFKYGGVKTLGPITITPSTTCDVTVSLLNQLS